MIEAQGVPRMAGRILGALLVADPPEQTADQLARALHASRSSISTMTRLLENLRLIDRVSKPGDRRLYYRNRPDAWHQSMVASVASIRSLRQLAGRGLALLADRDDEVLRGLRDLYQFAAYWEREMPRMLARWREARERGDLPPLPEGAAGPTGPDA